MARPKHILLDDSYYFMTCRTYKRYPFFNEIQSKKILLDTLKESTKEMSGCRLEAWVILDEHYHIIVWSHQGDMISRLIKLIHGRSSRRLRTSYSEDRLISLSSGGFSAWKVWDNYWDRIIRDQEDLNIHLNYILYNPVKHGYVDDPKDYKMVWVRGMLSR